jgi:hypothetical protein
MQRVLLGAASDLDLPAADNFVADGADAFVVERIPVPVIIHRPKDFESILGVQPLVHSLIKQPRAMFCQSGYERILP